MPGGPARGGLRRERSRAGRRRPFRRARARRRSGPRPPEPGRTAPSGSGAAASTAAPEHRGRVDEPALREVGVVAGEDAPELLRLAAVGERPGRQGRRGRCRRRAAPRTSAAARDGTPAGRAAPEVGPGRQGLRAGLLDERERLGPRKQPQSLPRELRADERRARACGPSRRAGSSRGDPRGRAVRRGCGRREATGRRGPSPRAGARAQTRESESMSRAAGGRIRPPARPDAARARRTEGRAVPP